jgi:hypothetical protein
MRRMAALPPEKNCGAGQVERVDEKLIPQTSTIRDIMGFMVTTRYEKDNPSRISIHRTFDAQYHCPY